VPQKTQEQLDRDNAQFWDELCGTTMAKNLGITDRSPASLKRFDDAYFETYPYLLSIVDPESLSGKRVLEIGLGYGTLGQKLVEAGADYTGLDIAEGPVAMMNHRLQMHALSGRVVSGSALQMPFAERSFDMVIAIGCFHHTGDVQRCLDETARVLDTDGQAIMMVYNKYSLRQWLNWPKLTFGELLRGIGLRHKRREVAEQEKKVYDFSLAAGNACPETVFLSVGDLKKMLRPAFCETRFLKRNSDAVYVRGRLLFTRARALKIVGPVMGLDIYMRTRKRAA
jgi:SAM-dependent methyltransferase